MKRGWQLVWILMWSGCAGDLRDPGRFAFIYDDAGGVTGDAATDASSEIPIPPPPSCVTALFNTSCGMNSACHAPNATQIDLASAGVERRLVGKASTTVACRDRVYVSTDGSASLILDKLEDEPPCGTKMPIGPELSPADTTCLSDWVDSLAR